MTYQQITEAAFLDELEKIGGLGSGLMNFVRGGAGGFRALGSQAGRYGLMGELKALPGQLGRAWKGGGIGQAGNVLRYSAPVQMAALGAGGLYAGHKALNMMGGGQPPQR